MPPTKHSLTGYITVLNEKANKSNHYALCRFCKTKLTNTKKLVTSHLKNCTIFKEQYTEHEQKRILFCEDENNQYDGDNFLVIFFIEINIIIKQNKTYNFTF
jgi:hypothetical protein